MTRNNKTVIDNSVAAIHDMARGVMLEAFRKLRDDALSYAESNHEFKNQTMNLEDSYAAAIYYNGHMIEKTISDKEAIKARAYKGKDYFGHEESEKFLNGYAAGDGYSLVVVAGQFYAAWVEAIHGLDVLTGAFSETKENISNSFRDIKTYYNKSNV